MSSAQSPEEGCWRSESGDVRQSVGGGGGAKGLKVTNCQKSSDFLLKGWGGGKLVAGTCCRAVVACLVFRGLDAGFAFIGGCGVV